MALAQHYREFEGLSNRQIADRLGRSPATVKVYFYDPTGERRYQPVRYMGCRPRGRRAVRRGAARERPVVSELAIGQYLDLTAA